MAGSIFTNLRLGLACLVIDQTVSYHLTHTRRPQLSGIIHFLLSVTAKRTFLSVFLLNIFSVFVTDQHFTVFPLRLTELGYLFQTFIYLHDLNSLKNSSVSTLLEVKAASASWNQLILQTSINLPAVMCVLFVLDPSGTALQQSVYI